MDGVINVYKLVGMTSFDVVRKVRNISNTKKVGHTGTLDPEASGVLPICIGKATKIVDYIMNEDKIYKAKLKLGIVTDTYDKEGNIIENNEVNVSEEEINFVINDFIGNIKQIPPMYSAIKVKGKRLYDLARKGIEIERKPRDITIHYIKILNINIPYVDIEVFCSKGTYIRSLCYDIGKKLNCGASMWALERIKTGGFQVHNSIEIDKLDKTNILNYLIPIDEALYKYDKIYLDIKYKNLVLNGVVLKDYNVLKNLHKDKIYRVYLQDNSFIGLGKYSEYGFKIIKLLFRE
ncbi:tRNA pseudouridine synthase B [Clostridium acetireducens DSM 10703]|uniref:tRNA pseudouridine synthase B n=1 Tax=Clostridium acetireducens DSM 10703 TaxID=1121290 RepID=A0A1E8F255_9CLOT|nr:tRNA pseudouridine(55) synthase TruB [Clostridium acetireducens]OFI07732.1 tRNA pseudouridine synthase B [Clostridium acetireducens DSM 10703]